MLKKFQISAGLVWQSDQTNADDGVDKESEDYDRNWEWRKFWLWWWWCWSKLRMKGALEATSGKLGQAASSSNHSLSWWCIRTSFPTKSTQITSTAQCVLCSVYFSAEPNKLRPILNNWVLVSQWTNTCPSLFECAENIFFSHFCDFQTLDPWFPLKYTLSPYCIGYRVIKDTGASHWTKYTLCTGEKPYKCSQCSYLIH